MQQDPIGSGVNWYAYAGNNPVVWIDPTGLGYSISFGAYALVGADLTVGWDDCTGMFFGGRLGAGLGGGISIDTKAFSPGAKAGLEGSGSYWGLGADAAAGLNVMDMLTLGIGYEATSGFAYDSRGQEYATGGHRPTQPIGIGRGLAEGAGGGAGADGLSIPVDGEGLLSLVIGGSAGVDWSLW